LTSSEEEEDEEEELEAGEVVVETTAVSELSLGDADDSSILTPSTPSEAESSRNATVGDTTLQDVGSILPVVRFPSIFTHDMDYSSLESSRTATPLSPLLALQSDPIDADDLEHFEERGYGPSCERSSRWKYSFIEEEVLPRWELGPGVKKEGIEREEDEDPRERT
jgi:hypothetical protein